MVEPLKLFHAIREGNGSGASGSDVEEQRQKLICKMALMLRIFRTRCSVPKT